MRIMDSRDENLRKTLAAQHEALTKMIDAILSRPASAAVRSPGIGSLASASGIPTLNSRFTSTPVPSTPLSLSPHTTHTTQPVPPLSSTQIFPFLTSASLIPTQPPHSLYSFQIYTPFHTTTASTPISTPLHHATFTQPVITTSLYPPPPPFPPPPITSMGTSSTYPQPTSTYSSPMPNYSAYNQLLSHTHSTQPNSNFTNPTQRSK
jgi:hypothetical protein